MREPDYVIERDGVWLAKLYLGDCLDILPTLEPGSVDAVITDPPYGVNAAEWDGASPYHVLPELLRVASGPVLWTAAAPRLLKDITSFPVAPQRVLIWHVTFSLASTSANGIFYRYHPIYAWNLPKTQDGINRDVIECSQNGGSNWWHHPGTKPVELMRKLVMVGGNICADPFMGSGTTGVACAQTGRRFIGVEIDPGYFEIAVTRIQKAYDQQLHAKSLDLFDSKKQPKTKNVSLF